MNQNSVHFRQKVSHSSVWGGHERIMRRDNRCGRNVVYRAQCMQEADRSGRMLIELLCSVLGGGDVTLLFVNSFSLLNWLVTLIAAWGRILPARP